MDIIPETDLINICNTFNIKIRGDIIVNILESYQDANNLYLENYENMLRRLIGEDIRLETYYDSNLKHCIADSGQIGQVIMNLALNGRDAMLSGGLLKIRTEAVTINEEYCKTYKACSIDITKKAIHIP